MWGRRPQSTAAGHVLERPALGRHAEEQLDGAADHHDARTDQVADEEPEVVLAVPIR